MCIFIFFRFLVEHLLSHFKRVARGIFFISVVLASVITTSTVVYSDPITYRFSGEIVNDFIAPVPNVQIGTTYIGSFTYDDSLSATVLGPKTSVYMPATLEVNFTSPSNVQSVLNINNARVRIDNDNASDVFEVQAGSTFGIPFDFNGLAVQQFRLFFIDNSAVVYSDTSLPTVLILQDFDVSNLTLLTEDADPGTSDRFSSTGTVSILESVPTLVQALPITVQYEATMTSVGDGFPSGTVIRGTYVFDGAQPPSAQPHVATYSVISFTATIEGNEIVGDAPSISVRNDICCVGSLLRDGYGAAAGTGGSSLGLFGDYEINQLGVSFEKDGNPNDTLTSTALPKNLDDLSGFGSARASVATTNLNTGQRFTQHGVITSISFNPAIIDVSAVELVSINETGTDSGNGGSLSDAPVISADGRFVAFTSSANDLVGDDNNANLDVFVRDLQTGTTRLVSVNETGIGSGNSWSEAPAISADGRFVAFHSFARDLPGDTNGYQDVFVRDMQTGTTTQVSRNYNDTASGNYYSGGPVISADGRFVAFFSYSSDLVVGDHNLTQDVFVRDLQTGTTRLISVNETDTNSGNGGSWAPVISADGRFVAFLSTSSDLVADDTNGYRDVFVRDLQTGTTRLVSVNETGTNTGNGYSDEPVISADGRFVAFASFASDLAADDTNGYRDVFVRDLQTSTTTLVSRNFGGTSSGLSISFEPVISADGRFVAFSSDSIDLVADDTNNYHDVFVYDLQIGTTTLVSRNFSGTSSNSYSEEPVISADGRFVAFYSRAGDLVANDTNPHNFDVFVRDLQTGTTRLVSVNETGIGSGNGSSFAPVISADGRVVAFISDASDLVADDSNDTYDVFVAELVADADKDGILGDIDNCPQTANTDQADVDGDGIGDACDLFPNDALNDIDGDSISGDIDNCPQTPNTNQVDVDGDGIGDACDPFPNDALNDIDEDSIGGDIDNCPQTANANQTDVDGDDIGDVCDSFPNDALNDIDGDGISGHIDNCPSVANPDQIDLNGDDYGDACVDPSVNIPADSDVDPTVTIGTDSTINTGVVIEEDVVLGDNVAINSDVMVEADVTIADEVILNKGSAIGTGSNIGNNVSIGQGVFIGEGVTIGDGVVIGRDAVICANAQIAPLLSIGKNVLVDTGVSVTADIGGSKSLTDPSACTP